MEKMTGRKNKIIGEIVLFNPQIDLLKQNIAAIIHQVDFLLLVDNHSDNILQIKTEILNQYQNVKFVCNDENRGIAAALNQGIDYAWDREYDWILSMDQDSEFALNGICEYEKYISLLPEVVMFCPRIRDTSLDEITERKDGEYVFVDRAITSGSLVNVKIAHELKYDEWMFIDSVDFEFCWRLKENGYQIAQINNVVLNHSIGDHAVRHKFLNQEILVYNHSVFRKYYQVRNPLYFKMKRGERVGMEYVVLKILANWVLVLLWDRKDKWKKMKAIYRGARDFWHVSKLSNG